MHSPATARSAYRYNIAPATRGVLGSRGDTGNVSSAYFEEHSSTRKHLRFRELRLSGSRYFCMKKRQERGPFHAEIKSRNATYRALLERIRAWAKKKEILKVGVAYGTLKTFCTPRTDQIERDLRRSSRPPPAVWESSCGICIRS